MTLHAGSIHIQALLSRLKVTAVAFVLIFSIGLHWPLLQSLAWLNMIVSYSQQNGVTEAVAMTFSGKHPCKLCKLVEAGQKAEKRECKESFLKKLDLFAEDCPPVYWGNRTSEVEPSVNCSAEELHYPPLSPPPNRA